MSETVVYGVLVCAGGRAASLAEARGSLEEALAVVREVCAGLGVPVGRWVKAGPGVRTMAGPEGGGWCVVLWQGLAPEWKAPPKPKGRRVAGSGAPAAGRPAPAPGRGVN